MKITTRRTRVRKTETEEMRDRLELAKLDPKVALKIIDTRLTAASNLRLLLKESGITRLSAPDSLLEEDDIETARGLLEEFEDQHSLEEANEWIDERVAEGRIAPNEEEAFRQDAKIRFSK